VEELSLKDGAVWGVRRLTADGSDFEVTCEGTAQGRVTWDLKGEHNLANGLAALAAARHAGIPVAQGAKALCEFRGIKRRLELLADVGGIRVYDDFAHHPTAIATTLEGLRAAVGAERIIAILEPRSNTMRMGVMAERLPQSLRLADRVLVHAPASLGWDAAGIFAAEGERISCHEEVDAMVELIAAEARPGDHLLIMSNGGFGGIHQKLIERLKVQA
jgi:UDP-N-acetylmuramate: L-alanyl-gamma-D-glutamyl-meso-diaminopimelate ligase